MIPNACNNLATELQMYELQPSGLQTWILMITMTPNSRQLSKASWTTVYSGCVKHTHTPKKKKKVKHRSLQKLNFWIQVLFPNNNVIWGLNATIMQILIDKHELYIWRTAHDGMMLHPEFYNIGSLIKSVNYTWDHIILVYNYFLILWQSHFTG